jgi:cell division protein FtsB
MLGVPATLNYRADSLADAGQTGKPKRKKDNAPCPRKLLDNVLALTLCICSLACWLQG